MTGRKPNRIINNLIVLAVVVFTIIGCGQHPIYSHFEHIQPTGWQRNDTLRFSIHAKDAGNYCLSLDLRATSLFPFTELVLVVERYAHLKHERRTDTLYINITDKDGNREGAGISMFSYGTPLTPVMLEDHDTLDISVRHAMTRQCLQGITDVGITAEANCAQRQYAGK